MSVTPLIWVTIIPAWNPADRATLWSLTFVIITRPFAAAIRTPGSNRPNMSVPIATSSAIPAIANAARSRSLASIGRQ